MRIVPFDALPPRLEPERAAIEVAAFSSRLPRAAIQRMRRLRYAFSPYVSLFALDGARLLGGVHVLRLPFGGRHGPMTVSGIGGVTTRADAARRGVARALLEEVHRREVDAGSRFAILWTNRSWFAHDLYTELGYRDVYVPPVAVRVASGRPSAVPGETLRPARPGELAQLEALHEAFSLGRTGFAPRSAGFLTVERSAGFLPLGDLYVYRRGRRRVGYAVIARGPAMLRSGELVAPREDLPALLRAIEREAGARLVVLGQTPVRDLAPFLRRSGYLVRRDLNWGVLMARPLAERLGEAELRRELTVDRSSFLSMTLDAF